MTSIIWFIMLAAGYMGFFAWGYFRGREAEERRIRAMVQEAKDSEQGSVRICYGGEVFAVGVTKVQTYVYQPGGKIIEGTSPRGHHIQISKN